MANDEYTAEQAMADAQEAVNGPGGWRDVLLVEKILRGRAEAELKKARQEIASLIDGELDCSECGCLTNNGVCTGCRHGTSPMAVLKKERDHWKRYALDLRTLVGMYNSAVGDLPPEATKPFAEAGVAIVACHLLNEGQEHTEDEAHESLRRYVEILAAERKAEAK